MEKGLMTTLVVICLFCQPVPVYAESQINEFSYEEAQELMKIAFAEAGNQGAEGQRLVMSVILNRVSSPDYPDTIHDVIWQKSQFATKGMKKAEPTSETHEALAEIEKGNVAPEILAFERTGSSKLEMYFTWAFDYKDHSFYTAKIQ